MFSCTHVACSIVRTLHVVGTLQSTGSWAVNPVNGARLPIWVADYVLGSYGSGAIMAVPAHDARDYAFATAFDLPVVPVLAPADGTEVELPFTGACIVRAVNICRWCCLTWQPGNVGVLTLIDVVCDC
jgi:leucyl-tRNA synthetase